LEGATYILDNTSHVQKSYHRRTI